MSKHCRILALILSLTTLFCALPALGDGLPEAFSVTYKTEDRFVNHKRGFVSKEHIAAANPAVASEINALVDAYDEQYAPALQGQRPTQAATAAWISMWCTALRAPSG